MKINITVVINDRLINSGENLVLLKDVGKVKNLSHIKNEYTCKGSYFKCSGYSKLFLYLLIWIEKFVSNFRFLSIIYDKLFYRKMVENELREAELNHGDKILHIGCGSLPLTAIFLASNNYEVKGIDIEKEAVVKGKKLIKKFGYEKDVELKVAEGLNQDYFQYDVIWISLNVFPKQKIVKKIMEEIPDGGKVVFRNPRGWLESIYCPVRPEGLPHDYNIIRQPFNKESVIIRKGV